MLNVSASATMTILSKFFCEDDSSDKLVFIFYGVFNDKLATSPIFNETSKDRNILSHFLVSKNSANYLKKCFLILTQKKIKIYHEDIIHMYLIIPIINVENIMQDTENENYIEIIYKNEKNQKEKVEITIENKHYFVEKFLENYVYEKTYSTNSLIFFNLSDKVKFSESIGSSSSDLPIKYLLDFKFEDKFEEYDNYIKKLKDSFSNLAENKKNENAFEEKNNKSLKVKELAEINNRGINNSNNKNTNLQTNYARKIFRFKKNLFLIPSKFEKKSNDVFHIQNPENKECPIKLIIGSSKTFPVELLDYDSDISDIKEVAYEKLYRTIENITGKVDFYITRSEKYFKQKEFKSFEDLGKTETWILEAKTKIKKNCFNNIIMLFIRKAFYPPFFDTFKDYYFFVMEKIELPRTDDLIKGFFIKEDVIQNTLVLAHRQIAAEDNQQKNKSFNNKNKNVKENLLEVDLNQSKKNANEININIKENSVEFESQIGTFRAKKEKEILRNSIGLNTQSILDSQGNNKQNSSVETYEKDGKFFRKVTKKVFVKVSKSGRSSSINNNKNHSNYSINDNLNNNSLNDFNESFIKRAGVQNSNANETLNNEGSRKTKTVIVKKLVKIPKAASSEKDNLEFSIKSNKANSIANNSNKSFNRNNQNKEGIEINENENEKVYLVGGATRKNFTKKHSKIKAWTGEISDLARSVVSDIAETFNSMLSFHIDYLEKMKTLSLIRLESFSCFKSFYENSFRNFSKCKELENIKKLKTIGIDLLYKILLILKESSYDQISNDLDKIENKIKKVNVKDANYLFMHREKIKKSEFNKILEENDKLLDSLLTGYYKNTGENSKNFPKQKEKKQQKTNTELLENIAFESSLGNQVSKLSMTATRKLLSENRNDFIVFCLSGKLFKNSSLDLTKILKFSQRKDTIKSAIKNIVLPLLNLRSSFVIDNKTEKDLINEICESQENSRLHVSFNEEVLCAMIKSDFFRKGEIINLIFAYEKFLIFILEKHGSKRVLESVYNFLKEEKRNVINYDLMVQKNFNKNSYLENFYKKIDIKDKNYNNNSSSSANKSDYEKSLISSKTHLLLNKSELITPGIITESDKNQNYATKRLSSEPADFNINNASANKKTNKNLDAKPQGMNLKNSITEIKNKFEKELKNTSNNSDDMRNEKNDTLNQLTHNFCFILFKFYASYNSNLNKILISCKSLALLCKGNSTNRKQLVERGIFEVIFSHFAKFNEEKILISSLKLMNSLLDNNDQTVIDHLKSNDKWDDYLGNLIAVILNWRHQNIKCSSKLVSVLLDILISISNFKMVDLKKLFTVGYENKYNQTHNDIYDVDISLVNVNSKNNGCNSNNSKKYKKSKNKFLIFIEHLLDESYVNQAFADPQNCSEIYEKTLIFLCKNYEKIKSNYWMKNLVLKIEKNFDSVLKSFVEYFNKTKSTTNFKQGLDKELDSCDEARSFIYSCKVYFITLNFLKFIIGDHQEQLWKKINNVDSSCGKVLRFLNAVQKHEDFKYIWEKSDEFLELLEERVGEFQEYEDDLENEK